MTHRLLCAAALVLAQALAPSSAAAQDVPVVFVHGIFSSSSTWSGAAQRLGNTVRIAPHLADLPSTAVIESQATALQNAFGGLPASTIAVGHSQGGLVARQWSRTKPLRGILTLGTPHGGSQLAARGLDLINFNYLLYNVIGLLGAYGPGTEFNWIYALLQVYYSNTQSLAWNVATALASTVAVGHYVPAAPQLHPGSNFLGSLNASGNLARENLAVPKRVALAYTAHEYWRAGMAVGLSPAHREWAWWVMQVAPPAFEYAAAVIDTHYGPWNLLARTFAMRLRDAAGMVRDMDPQWCWAVTGDRSCRVPHDGIVAVDAQRYPGPGVLNFSVSGPPHKLQTSQSDGVIASVLSSVMGVPARGAAPAPPVPPPPGGGSDTLGPAQRLYPDQQVLSAGGGAALRYQSDGNLVLYGPHGGVFWDSGTVGESAGRTEMQSDGNLVIYNAANVPIWASDTYSPGAYLRVHDNGHIAIHDEAGIAIWWSGSGTS